MKNKISLHSPKFEGKEKKYLIECINSGWLSQSGKFVSTFEKIISGLNDRYPHLIGLKLIKSQTMHPDGTPFYCGIDASKTSTKSIMTAVGSVEEKKIISNVLSEYSVAPKTYD